MVRLKTSSLRCLFATLFALLLGARLLSPAGFMPSFAQGGIAIVACPDAGPPPAHHDHRQPKSEQPCPYAAAPALGTLADTVAVPLALVLFALVWALPWNVQLPLGAHRLRPPATGPPVLT